MRAPRGRLRDEAVPALSTCAVHVEERDDASDSDLATLDVTQGAVGFGNTSAVDVPRDDGERHAGEGGPIQAGAAGQDYVEIATRMASYTGGVGAAAQVQSLAARDELTARELEVLKLVARGLSNAEIAAELAAELQRHGKREERDAPDPQHAAQRGRDALRQAGRHMLKELRGDDEEARAQPDAVVRCAFITGDGELARTMPCPVPAGDRYRLRGARKAAASPLPARHR